MISNLAGEPSGSLERFETTVPEGWKSLGVISSHQDVFVQLKELMLHENKPFLVIDQFNGQTNDRNTVHYHKILKYDGTSWNLLTNDTKEGTLNYVSNLTSANGNLYRIFGWMHLQYFLDGKWFNVTNEGYSPVWPKQSTSYHPVLGFLPNKNPFVIWHDGDYENVENRRGDTWASSSELKNLKWQWLDKRAFQPGVSDVKLRYASDGTPYILYLDYDPEIYEEDHLVLSMMRLKNGKWEFVGKRGFNPGAVSVKEYDFEINGDTPYVIFKYSTDWTIKPVFNQVQKVAVMKFVQNNWQFVGDEIPVRDAPYHVNLEFTNTNSPVISYIDNFHFINTFQLKNGSWNKLGKLGSTPYNGTYKTGEKLQGYSLDDLLMKVDSQNNVYVVFLQKTVLKSGTMNRNILELKSYKYEL